MSRATAVGAIVVLAVLAVPGRHALGDGGTLRLSELSGGYRVAAFTSPAPLRAGPIDVSVLVQDAATDRVLDDARIRVSVTPVGRPGKTRWYDATAAAASNRLLRAAVFDLPSAGKWHVDVRVDGGRGPTEVGFDMIAAGPLPRWFQMAIWIGLPAIPIFLFGVHEMLVEANIRRRHRARRTCGQGIHR